MLLQKTWINRILNHAGFVTLCGKILFLVRCDVVCRGLRITVDLFAHVLGTWIDSDITYNRNSSVYICVPFAFVAELCKTANAQTQKAKPVAISMLARQVVSYTLSIHTEACEKCIPFYPRYTVGPPLYFNCR